MLPSTGIQKSENISIIKLRVAVIYLGSLGVIFVPFSWPLAALTLVSVYVRTFGWEGGHHRYFAHRSFKTSRIFQLVLACLGAASGQRGPIWWATHHRDHHRYSDTPRDPHTPIKNGKLYAYIGWFFDKAHCDTNLDDARDLSRFPELVWVNKYHYFFPYLFLVLIFAIGQWTPLLGGVGGVAAVVWGFFLGTLLSLQGSLLVNAFAHGSKPGPFSYRTFRTSDTSLNNLPLCLLSLGASWHNNHHRYMNSARTGFRWWELDLTYMTLRVLEIVGIVWDLHKVPPQVLLEISSARSVSR